MTRDEQEGLAIIEDVLSKAVDVRDAADTLANAGLQRGAGVAVRARRHAQRALDELDALKLILGSR